MTKVLKFGGTSMGDAAAIKQSLQVAQDQEADVVVVSAVGGVTDRLLEMLDMAENSEWSDCEVKLNDLKKTHQDVANELQLSDSVKSELNSLLDEAFYQAIETHIEVREHRRFFS